MLYCLHKFKSHPKNYIYLKGKTMNSSKFGTIFLGGIRRLDELPDKVTDWLDYFIDTGEHFIVGDRHGADLVFQNYLNVRRYTSVTVFCSGDKSRFNLGKWQEVHVTVEDGAYDEKQKDDAMIESCDGALLVWNGQSTETASKIRELRCRGLPIFIYRTDLDRLRVVRGNCKLEKTNPNK